MSDDLRTRIAAILGDHHALAGCNCPGVDELHGQTLHLADAVIRELATDCATGCMWQIPDRVEDMTPEQRELLGKPPLFGQHFAVGDDGPIMLNISPKEDDA